jgi:hypothetical protein
MINAADCKKVMPEKVQGWDRGVSRGRERRLLQKYKQKADYQARYEYSSMVVTVT